MKTIGIIDAMSWQSSPEYYRLIIENIKARLGSAHSVDFGMCSMDFYPIAQLELEERWTELETILISATARLEKAGASNAVTRVLSEFL